MKREIAHTQIYNKDINHLLVTGSVFFVVEDFDFVFDGTTTAIVTIIAINKPHVTATKVYFIFFDERSNLGLFLLK